MSLISLISKKSLQLLSVRLQKAPAPQEINLDAHNSNNWVFSISSQVVGFLEQSLNDAEKKKGNEFREHSITEITLEKNTEQIQINIETRGGAAMLFHQSVRSHLLETLNNFGPSADLAESMLGKGLGDPHSKFTISGETAKNILKEAGVEKQVQEAVNRALGSEQTKEK